MADADVDDVDDDDDEDGDGAKNSVGIVPKSEFRTNRMRCSDVNNANSEGIVPTSPLSSANKKVYLFIRVSYMGTNEKETTQKSDVSF